MPSEPKTPTTPKSLATFAKTVAADLSGKSASLATNDKNLEIAGRFQRLVRGIDKTAEVLEGKASQLTEGNEAGLQKLEADVASVQHTKTSAFAALDGYLSPKTR